MIFFKRFRTQIVLRILAMVAAILVLTYLVQNTKLYATMVFLAFLGVYQVYTLIRYVENTNRSLNRFILAIRYGDFAQTFSARGLGPTFADLDLALNDMIKKMRETRSEKEEQYRYLQTIVHHLATGLITFREDGTVELVNTAAKRLLKVSHLKNIHALESFKRDLSQKLLSLKTGERTLVKSEDGEMELVVRAAEFRRHGRKFTLVSLQNIQSELQEKEMEAWQNLVRVLTHEIMNSMTPITSMAATILSLINAKSGEPWQAEDLEDITIALQTIHKRSQGLTDFVNSYRNLTLIPKPNFKVLSIEDLFSRVKKLLEVKLKEPGIQLDISITPATLELSADPGLVEQVLINLVLNAREALIETKDIEKPLIQLTAHLDDNGRVIIAVNDNGPGIVPEALDNVFIPFFTTRKQGSGIGLALSRQIMKLHKGTISVQSQAHKHTCFTLKF